MAVKAFVHKLRKSCVIHRSALLLLGAPGSDAPALAPAYILDHLSSPLVVRITIRVESHTLGILLVHKEERAILNLEDDSQLP